MRLRQIQPVVFHQKRRDDVDAEKQDDGADQSRDAQSVSVEIGQFFHGYTAFLRSSTITVANRNTLENEAKNNRSRTSRTPRVRET